ncbi:hypothetical protein K7711_25545 [Nocardia sp. CA2R105]|uniref:hypothetical protein n=1 Tax=Nocardia coffeae TaxID=2873381 RepID=UPI001CA78494|nr:hypothetical protein [Nocardia coffeae]MBY8859858.1 hypothetical protein [Nocardia coffeae]
MGVPTGIGVAYGDAESEYPMTGEHHLREFRTEVREWCRAETPSGWRVAQPGIGVASGDAETGRTR